MTQNAKVYPNLVEAGKMGGVTHCKIMTGGVRQHDSSVTAAGVLYLEYQKDGDKEMPLVQLAAKNLLYTLTSRTSGRLVTRSILETKANFLRETRFTNHPILINDIIDEKI